MSKQYLLKNANGEVVGITDRSEEVLALQDELEAGEVETRYYVSLCANRHEGLPEESIFPQVVENVMDFSALDEVAEKFFAARPDMASLDVFVTGLTPCLVAVLKAASKHSVRVYCLHYDKNSGNYLPQEV